MSGFRLVLLLVCRSLSGSPSVQAVNMSASTALAEESSSTSNGATGKKVARLANLPPAPPPALPRSSSDRGGRRGDGPYDGQGEQDDEDDDYEEDAESDFDEKTVNTGGNTLADRIQAKLDEREFHDEAKRNEKAENGDTQHEAGDGDAELLQESGMDLLAEYPDDSEVCQLSRWKG